MNAPLHKATFVAFAITTLSCNGAPQQSARNQSNSISADMSAFAINEYVPAQGNPDWQTVTIVMMRQDGDKKEYDRSVDHRDYKAANTSTLSIQIPQGLYKINLVYKDTTGQVVYEACASTTDQTYLINSPQFTSNVLICRHGSGNAAGSVPVVPASSVVLKPVSGDATAASPAGSPDAPLPVAVVTPTPLPKETPKAPQPAVATGPSCKDASGQTRIGYDLVQGQCVDRKASFYVDGGSIYNRGNKLRINGINWFGLEGNYLGLNGLWSGRNLQSFVDQMQGLGLNAFRIPLSPEALDDHRRGQDGYSSPLAQLKWLLQYTGQKGMYVLLDLHTCSMNNASTNKPGPATGSCSFYSEATWTNDLVKIATLAADYPNVIGIDLFNEPYGLTWHDWKGMTERAGAAILAANPHLLTFIEGVASDSPYGATGPFWGENLYEAASQVPNLPPSRLVYSPHVYGPSVSQQDYFNGGNFPGNMPAIWDQHFGYLLGKGFALAVGEFGGTYYDNDKTWQDAFVSYLLSRNLTNTFYWSMNPNSGDTHGLLYDDWKSVDQGKLHLLQRLMSAP